MRVLGNSLSLPDFDYDDVAQVATELGQPPEVLMQADKPQIPVSADVDCVSAHADGLFSLVAERSIYQTDPIVRRSRALSLTRDGASEGVLPSSSRGPKSGGPGRSVSSTVGRGTSPGHPEVTEDSGVVRGSVFVFSGSVATAGFGGDSTVRIRPVT